MRKPFLLGMFFCCCMTAPMSAQHSFLHKLQKKEVGQGTVNVHQSEEISRLVNGTATGKAANEKNTTPKTAGKQTEKNIRHHQTDSAAQRDREAELRHKQDSIREAREAEERRMAAEKKEAGTERPHTSEADRQREKRERYDAFVRAPKRKVRGFRVQVYAGDNTRKARQKAQSVAVQIKSYFPELAVYAHFVSPRWVCRAGDFRTYGEAQAYLRKIRAKKFREALIVKTTILVIAR